MPPKEQQNSEFVSPTTLPSRTKFMITGIGLVAAVYFGFIAPAQQHMAALEHQCAELTAVVNHLAGQEASAERGLQLISILEEQNKSMAAAEASLADMIELRQKLVEEAKAITATASSLEQLQAVREQVSGHNERLMQMTDILAEMAEVADSIAYSGEIAVEAKDSLRNLEEVQTNLVNGITSVSQQLVSLESQIVNRDDQLTAAKKTLNKINMLCEEMSTKSENVTMARNQLADMAQLKDEILTGATGLNEAAAVIETLMDLRDHVLRSSETVAATQQMVVDVMLMEPALERAVAALKPMNNHQRLSRRAAAENQAPVGNADNSAAHNGPWTEMLKVAVSMLIPLG